MTRIAIVGYYGFGNLGDEMILASLVRAVTSAHPSSQITVLSGSPESTRRMHGVDAVAWNDPGAIIETVAEADGVVLGGGGLFHDYWGVDPEAILNPAHWGIAYYAGVAGLAGALQVPLELFAVGVGPLLTEGGRRLTRECVRIASGASVRDEDSAVTLAALGFEGVEIAPDPAWAFDPPARAAEPAPSAGPPRIGVALRT